METMYERIKRLRQQKGMNQEELAIKCGFVSRSSISKIEKGQRDIRQGQILALAKALDVTPQYLMDGIEPNAEFTPFVQVPLFDSISAGLGTTRDEPIGTHPVVVHSKEEAENTLCVTVSGDSMSPRIENGDIIQIRQQRSVDSGDLAAVLLDDANYFVKKVEYGADYIRLISLNPDYKPIVLRGAEVQRCFVLGKVMTITKRC